MVPEIDAVEGEGAQRPICLDAAAGFCHRGAMLGRHSERAHRVEQHADLHTRTAALRERARDVPRRLAVLEDVLGVGDRPPGFTDGGQLGRKDLLAVQEDAHPVAADHAGPGVSAESRRERGLRHVERGKLEVGRDTRARGHEDEHEGESEPCRPTADAREELKHEGLPL